MISSVVIIGTGNVAWHLASRLSIAGIKTTVVARKEAQDAQFSGMDHVAVLTRADEEIRSATIIMLCVNDDSIQEVGEMLRPVIGHDQLIAHTSGTKPGSALSQLTGHWGSFWPVQTLRKGIPTLSGSIPVVITAGTMYAQTWLTALAQRISCPHTVTEDRLKSHLHLGAVMVNNFTNHMMSLTEEYCLQKDVDFSILKPLILETALKIQQQSPGTMQTGPAVRGDEGTIEQHIAMLTDFPELQDLYKFFSNSIIKMYHEDHRRI